MTGLEVLQQLREGPNGGVPIIVVTVVAEKGAVAGFAVHDVLAKPCVEASLLASLHRAGVKGGRGVVLVVDDDPASLKVMSATLGRLGYLAVCEQIACAAFAPRPRSRLRDRARSADAGHDGVRVPREISTTAAARNVPVIVWTSKDFTAEELARFDDPQTRSSPRVRTVPRVCWRSSRRLFPGRPRGARDRAAAERAGRRRPAVESEVAIGDPGRDSDPGPRTASAAKESAYSSRTRAAKWKSALSK